ncbi:MAG: monovalent cation/H(+) antiporter subunit G [Eubacteriales bacterium]|nr:monovalent cation/H(+) antiporter subunit G [Eubacteriales bacterium]
MLDWIRFGLTAALLLSGLVVLATGVVAQYRFHYVINRMHAASMGDSLGLLLVVLSLCVSMNDGWVILKYLLVTVFLWLTSPTAGHLIARLELTTNEHPEKEMELIRK